MKNILIVLLSLASAGAGAYGYMKGKETLETERKAKAYEDAAKEAQTQAAEFQKMYGVAMNEIQIQRTLCEEQLKTLRQSK
jgi:hypothetical protein